MDEHIVVFKWLMSHVLSLLASLSANWGACPVKIVGKSSEVSWGPEKPPSLQVGGVQAEAWASLLPTEQLYFSVSYKLRFTGRLHSSVLCKKKEKFKKLEKCRSSRFLPIPLPGTFYKLQIVFLIWEPGLALWREGWGTAAARGGAPGEARAPRSVILALATIR